MLPANGATGVSVTSVIAATFSDIVNASTINDSTFIVRVADTRIPGSVTLSNDNRTATFDATPDLSPNTRYTATIAAAVKDMSGVQLAENQSWSFTTGSEQSIDPIRGPTPDLILFFIIVVASAMVIPLIIDMVLAHHGMRKMTNDQWSRNPVGMQGLYRTLMTFGIILLLGMVIFYVLWLITQNIRNEASEPLVNILQNLSTILGTALATIIAFYFGMRGTTSSVEKAAEAMLPHREDLVPRIINTVPADEEKEVRISTLIAASFNRPMSPSAVNTSNFTVMKEDGTRLKGILTLSSDGKTVAFDPDPDLELNTRYLVHVSAEMTDLSGNPLTPPKRWSFITESMRGPLQPQQQQQQQQQKQAQDGKGPVQQGPLQPQQQQ